MLGAPHGLGRRRCPRREEQGPQDIGVACPADRFCPRCARPGGIERRPERRADGRGVVVVTETLGNKDAAGQINTPDRRAELCLVPGLGDHELEVGVHDVAAEVLAARGCS